MGGEARLAGALQVPERDLHRWLDGSAYPSTQVYQKALDLLISIGKN